MKVTRNYRMEVDDRGDEKERFVYWLTQQSKDAWRMQIEDPDYVSKAQIALEIYYIFQGRYKKQLCDEIKEITFVSQEFEIIFFNNMKLEKIINCLFDIS